MFIVVLFFCMFFSMWLNRLVLWLKLLVVCIEFLLLVSILFIELRICLVSSDWCWVIVIWLVGVLFFSRMLIIFLYFICSCGMVLVRVEVIWCRDSMVCLLVRMELVFLCRLFQFCCIMFICGFIVLGLGGRDVFLLLLIRMFQCFLKLLCVFFRSLNVLFLFVVVLVVFFVICCDRMCSLLVWLMYCLLWFDWVLRQVKLVNSNMIEMMRMMNSFVIIELLCMFVKRLFVLIFFIFGFCLD